MKTFHENFHYDEQPLIHVLKKKTKQNSDCSEDSSDNKEQKFYCTLFQLCFTVLYYTIYLIKLLNVQWNRMLNKLYIANLMFHSQLTRTLHNQYLNCDNLLILNKKKPLWQTNKQISFCTITMWQLKLWYQQMHTEDRRIIVLRKKSLNDTHIYATVRGKNAEIKIHSGLVNWYTVQEKLSFFALYCNVLLYGLTLLSRRWQIVLNNKLEFSTSFSQIIIKCKYK